MKKKVRIKVRESTCCDTYDFAIFKGRKMLMHNSKDIWKRKDAAVRNAKVMAILIGIPYEPGIIRHDC